MKNWMTCSKTIVTYSEDETMKKLIAIIFLGLATQLAWAIDIQSERTGDVPGKHDVFFESPTERLEFSHSVTTREVFAEGAVRAALWAVRQQPGLYSMQDVLFAD